MGGGRRGRLHARGGGGHEALSGHARTRSTWHLAHPAGSSHECMWPIAKPCTGRLSNSPHPARRPAACWWWLLASFRRASRCHDLSACAPLSMRSLGPAYLLESSVQLVAHLVKAHVLYGLRATPRGAVAPPATTAAVHHPGVSRALQPAATLAITPGLPCTALPSCRTLESCRAPQRPRPGASPMLPPQNWPAAQV